MPDQTKGNDTDQVRETLRGTADVHMLARVRAARAANERRQAAVAAKAAGLTLREIGEELGGLTTGRVQQILDSPEASIERLIEARRDDPEFQARLERILDEDREVLDRLGAD